MITEGRYVQLRIKQSKTDVLRVGVIVTLTDVHTADGRGPFQAVET